MTVTGATGAGDNNNPTYILPVDPYNYFPFFNGFSNVNPLTAPFQSPSQMFSNPAQSPNPMFSNPVVSSPRYVDPYHPTYPLGVQPPPYPLYDPNYSFYRLYGQYGVNYPAAVAATSGQQTVPMFPQFSELSSEMRFNKVSKCENCDYGEEERQGQGQAEVTQVQTQFFSRPSKNFQSFLQSGERRTTTSKCENCKFIDE